MPQFSNALHDHHQVKVAETIGSHLLTYKHTERESKARTRCITESIMNVVVECVPVAVVVEAIVVGRELLQALCGDGGKVAGDLSVVR